MSNHSLAAALIDFCDCSRCIKKRHNQAYMPWMEDSINNFENWWFFTIRCPDIEALVKHRKTVMEMGFYVEEIRNDVYLKNNKYWFTFVARIPKKELSLESREYLNKWDRQWE